MIEPACCRVLEEASRWVSRGQELAVAEKVFCGLLYWFHDFREFIEAELGQTEPRGPHNIPGHALVSCGPMVHRLVFSEASCVSFVQKKISKKFRGIWT